MTNIIYKELSETVIGLVYQVHKILGPGLLESAYENAVCWELKYADIPYQQQQAFPLFYKGDIIGNYITDVVVDNKIILELKSVKELTELMTAQLLHNLKLTKMPVGYLINFNSLSVDCKRYENSSV